MKRILKYLFFLVLGIIIFVLYNDLDNFSVGIPYCIRSISAPGSPVPSTRIAFRSRAEAEAESEGNDDLEVIECDIDGNPITTSVCSARRHRYDDYRQQLRGIYFITGNEIERLVSGSYDTSAIFLTDEEFTLVWNLLQNCTYEEGEQVASILRSDNKDNFLRDLSRSTTLEYLYDTPDEISIRYQSLINYYSNNTITLEFLVEYGIGYTVITHRGDFTLFRLTITDSDLFHLNIDIIRNFNVRSGNSRPHFGLPDDTNYITYALGESIHNFIRCRINYDPRRNYLQEFTAFPVGHGYGVIFLRMLYESSEDVLIRSFEVDTPENIKAYRSLFRYSVTPKSLNRNGFVEGEDYDYTIFRPNRDLMILVYPRYKRLWDSFSRLRPRPNRLDFNLFLMSLDEDVLTENLFNNFRPNILKRLYDDF